MNSVSLYFCSSPYICVGIIIIIISLEMVSLSLTTYLNELLTKMNSQTNYYCKLKYSLEEYKETSRLLGAAGHNTANLDGAIKETSKSMDKLIQANATAVANFKLHGIISFQSHEITEDESAKLQ